MTTRLNDSRWRSRWHLQKENSRRLREMGLPDNLFDPDFEQKEAAAKAAELEMLERLEAEFLAGNLGDGVQWQAAIAEWKARIAHPLHFASTGHRPRWVDRFNDAASDWRQRERGTRYEAFDRYNRKRREAAGMKPRNFKNGNHKKTRK